MEGEASGGSRLPKPGRALKRPRALRRGRSGETPLAVATSARRVRVFAPRCVQARVCAGLLLIGARVMVMCVCVCEEAELRCRRFCMCAPTRAPPPNGRRRRDA